MNTCNYLFRCLRYMVIYRMNWTHLTITVVPWRWRPAVRIAGYPAMSWYQSRTLHYRDIWQFLDRARTRDLWDMGLGMVLDEHNPLSLDHGDVFIENASTLLSKNHEADYEHDDPCRTVRA